MKPIWIVLTGGPGAGKTDAVQFLRGRLEKEGLKVMTVAESATEILSRTPRDAFASMAEFQNNVFRLQLEKEKAAEAAAGDGTVILCDRGLTDSAAYLTREEYEAIAREAGVTRGYARDHYDAVFHMETGAAVDGGYPGDSNPVRGETAAEALDADIRTAAVWTGTPHMRMIRAEKDFGKKLEKLKAEVFGYLGIPAPEEIEHKYLIRRPDEALLRSLPMAAAVPIVQTYLRREGEADVRLRMRGEGEDAFFFRTVKRWISPTERIEEEDRLTREEYEELMAQDIPHYALEKVRWCFLYDGQYFELDLYPFWQDRAVLELEVLHPDDPVTLPPWIGLIREVSGEKTFSNAALAQMI